MVYEIRNIIKKARNIQIVVKIRNIIKKGQSNHALYTSKVKVKQHNLNIFPCKVFENLLRRRLSNPRHMHMHVHT